MNLITKIRRLPTFAILVILAVTVYVAIRLVMFLSIAFVYLGFNLFVYIENLLQFTSVNPLVMWGILGLLIGSIFGVVVAVKKYKLPKKLIFYPISITILVIIILSFINRPTQLTGSFVPILDQNVSTDLNTNNTTTNTPSNYLYTVTQEMTVRESPSLSSARLFTLSRNERVRVLENVRDSKNNLWSKIEYYNANTGDKQTGYLKSKYLR